VVFVKNDAHDIDDALSSLFALHAARWERRGLPGVLADDEVQSFHRDVARRMLGAGALRMYTMRIADRDVAVFYGFAHGETVYYYLGGYDPDLERLSIGTLIVAHAVDEAVRDGAKQFDFLRGAEEYKYAWGAKDRVNRHKQWVREVPSS
jgi:CelD/BcsL family acetyltransferase involved in cellulose biosynthesis